MWVTVDASVAAAWLLPDEVSIEADNLYAQALAGEAAFQAPGLWAWEAGNLLHMAVRRGRLARADLRPRLQVLQRVSVRLDGPPDESRMHATLDMARDAGLTYYDASYLEQASRTGAGLATKDKALRRAALKAGLTCLTL